MCPTQIVISTYRRRLILGIIEADHHTNLMTPNVITLKLVQSFNVCKYFDIFFSVICNKNNHVMSCIHGTNNDIKVQIKNKKYIPINQCRYTVHIWKGKLKTICACEIWPGYFQARLCMTVVFSWFYLFIF